SGHCAGILSWVRGLPGYATTCDNLGSANDIAHDSRANPLEKALAVDYIVAEVTWHTVAIGASAVAACGSVGPCAAAIESVVGIGTTTATAACADGDCANEAGAVQQTAQRGITMLGSAVNPESPDYVEQAKVYGYKFFSMTPADWRALGT